MKTLIVDDQHDLFDYRFSMFGHTDVDFASTGKDALAKIQSQTYDLVLMDGNLLKGPLSGQQMQGPGVVLEIRKLDIVQPKIFMCTTDEVMQKKGADAGANGEIDKMLLFHGDFDAILAIVNK